MSEYVREAYIDLYVDTNKQTIQQRFKSLAALGEYLRQLDESGLHTTLGRGDEPQP